MKIKNKKNNDEINKNIRKFVTKEDLPDLTEELLELAGSINNKSFVLSFMKVENIGQYKFYGSLGFTVQNVGEGIVRCIQIYDDVFCLESLAMYAKTVEIVGGVLELGQFAIIAPVNKIKEEMDCNKSTAIGMEVA